MKNFNSILLCFVTSFLMQPLAEEPTCNWVKGGINWLSEKTSIGQGYEECKEKEEVPIASLGGGNAALTSTGISGSSAADIEMLKAEQRAMAAAAKAKTADDKAKSTTDKTASSDTQESVYNTMAALSAAGLPGMMSFPVQSIVAQSLEEEVQKMVNTPVDKKSPPTGSGYLKDGKGNVILMNGKPLSNDEERYKLVFDENGELISVSDGHKQLSYATWVITTKPESEVSLTLETADHDDYAWPDKTPKTNTGSTASTNLPVASSQSTVDSTSNSTSDDGQKDKNKKTSYTDDDAGTLSPSARASCAEGPIYVGVHSMACIEEYNKAQEAKGQSGVSQECGTDFIGPRSPGKCENLVAPTVPAKEEEPLVSSNVPEVADEKDEQTPLNMSGGDESSTEQVVANFWEGNAYSIPSEASDTEELENPEELEERGAKGSQGNLFYNPDIEDEQVADVNYTTDDEAWFADLLVENTANDAPSVTSSMVPQSKSADEMDKSLDEQGGNDELNTTKLSDLDTGEVSDVFSVNDFSARNLEKMASYTRDNMVIVSARSLKDEQTGVNTRSVTVISANGEEIEIMSGGTSQASQRIRDLRDSEVEAIALELGLDDRRQMIDECKSAMANRDSANHLEQLSEAAAIRKCLTDHIMLFSDELAITQDQSFEDY